MSLRSVVATDCAFQDEGDWVNHGAQSELAEIPKRTLKCPRPSSALALLRS
jgi:hypothetical protein